MIIIASGLAGLAYASTLRRRVRLVDGEYRWGPRQWRATAYFTGLALLVLSQLPVVDALTERFFWIHTAQYVFMLTVVAPLLVVGAPFPKLATWLPAGIGRLLKLVTGPVAAFVICNGTFWLLHFPAVYERVAATAVLRDLADLVLVGVGVFFWAQVIDEPPWRSRLSHLGRVMYLFAASAQMRVLALVLGFASAPFYPHHVQQAGGSALFDQQLGAGILLVPGVLTDTIVLTVCLYLWLAEEDRKHLKHGPGPGRRVIAGGGARAREELSTA